MTSALFGGLGATGNLSWPVAARGERLGGGPVQHARLTEVESLPGPSAANFATPHLGSAPLRAFHSVPSGVGYAPITPFSPRATNRAAVLLTETDSK